MIAVSFQLRWPEPLESPSTLLFHTHMSPVCPQMPAALLSKYTQNLATSHPLHCEDPGPKRSLSLSRENAIPFSSPVFQLLCTLPPPSGWPAVLSRGRSHLAAALAQSPSSASCLLRSRRAHKSPPDLLATPSPAGSPPGDPAPAIPASHAGR